MQKALVIIAITISLYSDATAQTETPIDAATVSQEIAEKIAKVSSFSATVETGEQSDTGNDPISSSSLLISKEFGWKMLGKEGGSAYQLITDYTTFYQYYPAEKEAMKTTADRAEMKAMLLKPATDMNPISLMDPKSLTYQGKETFDGQTVYRIHGTTQSQMMPGAPAVRRTLTALISTEDGLPRKTLESIGQSTGTTIYRNVILNPPVSPSDFTFAAPEGVTVIDVNAQMKRMNNTGAPEPKPVQP